MALDGRPMAVLAPPPARSPEVVDREHTDEIDVVDCDVRRVGAWVS